jgi:hypothetical protein
VTCNRFGNREHSSPCAGDGWCDACEITAGQMTENEMFLLMPSFVEPEP